MLTESEGEALRAAMAPLFDDMRRFVDRRIAELSVEVHGAMQLLGFSEENLTEQLNRLHEHVGNMLSAPSAATRNSGMELEAVVAASELAANQIMEAAEAINETVRLAMPGSEAMRLVSAKIGTIFEACEFQDLMEGTLTGILAPPGSNHEVFHPQAPTVVSSGADVNQADIDSLFD